MDTPPSPRADVAKEGGWPHSPPPVCGGASTVEVTPKDELEKREGGSPGPRAAFASSSSSSSVSSSMSSPSFGSPQWTYSCAFSSPTSFVPSSSTAASLNFSPLPPQRTSGLVAPALSHTRNPDACCSACGRPLDSKCAGLRRGPCGVAGLPGASPGGAGEASTPPAGVSSCPSGGGLWSLEESEGENTMTEWGLDTEPEGDPHAVGGEAGQSSSSVFPDSHGPADGADQAFCEPIGCRRRDDGQTDAAREDGDEVHGGEDDPLRAGTERRFSDRAGGAELGGGSLAETSACLRPRRRSNQGVSHGTSSRAPGPRWRSRTRHSASSACPSSSLGEFLLKPFRCFGFLAVSESRSRLGSAAGLAGLGVAGVAGKGAGGAGASSSGAGSGRGSASSGHAAPSLAQASSSEVQLEADKPLEKKLETFRVRSLWTIILVLVFFIILSAGHAYSACLVLALVASMYREIIAVKQKREEVRLPDFYLLKWYWFVITILGIGFPAIVRMPWRPWEAVSPLESWSDEAVAAPGPARSAVDSFGEAAPAQSVVPLFPAIRRSLERLLVFHSIVTYSAGFVGLVWFILSLRKGSMRYQFSQLGVMLVALMFIVGQSLMQIANIYSGLVWFILPTSLVIVNDVSAYVCGMLFGRTRLIRLSPKKTVEGFVGASFITLLWAVLTSKQLQHYKVFVCAPRMIDFRPFSMWRDLDCAVPDEFHPRCYDEDIEAFLGLKGWITAPPLEAPTLEDAAAGPGADAVAGLADEQRGAAEPRNDAEGGYGDHRSRQGERDAGRVQAGGAGRGDSLLAAIEEEATPENGDFVSIRREQQAVTSPAGESAPQDGRLVGRPRTAAGAGALSLLAPSSCRFFFSPFQFHSLILGVFAGFFAPFGGFFASGFKRAARIKDFGEIIPGHGGVTDRFDCQILTGMFTHLYYTSFVYNGEAKKRDERRSALPHSQSRSESRPRRGESTREAAEGQRREDAECFDRKAGRSSAASEARTEAKGVPPQLVHEKTCVEPSGGARAAGDAGEAADSTWIDGGIKAATLEREIRSRRSGTSSASSADGRDWEEEVLAAVASMEDEEELERLKARVVARLADLKGKKRRKLAQSRAESTDARRA
ncbi:phosphatidate cytidylyltransferase [Besnoitia besnoiti]|uniref:Phosphatidate cytidylyltransferase n=1 Tax=Besnoitia besnoiti TaxID=94643 RepID=A0A2A9M6I6_BESBE|nr:phosphatidate cytidylyltransferase [Besnoitia besnoiti]PFH31253.1 phosphatidate cytidylyltransferase [Besnoitia besnoiti]